MSAAAAPEAGGAAAAAFPWDEAMRAALRLGLAPAEFWRLAPRELAQLFSAHAPAAGAPSRSAMQVLMQRFPDAGPFDPSPSDPDPSDGG